MKKFSLLLVAMLVGLVANAADYYLIGGFNNWGLKQANCKFADQGDGTYVLDYAGVLSSGFKINDGTWSNNAANFGGSGNLIPGTPYNLTVGGSSGNIGLAEPISNPHLVLDPTAKTLLITGQAAESKISYGIHGSLSSSTWVTTDMTEKDGKWVADEVVVSYANAQFGIKKMDNGNQTDWISSPTPLTISGNGEYTLEVDGGNNLGITAGTYSFSFDPETMVLTVTGEGEEPPTPPTPGDKDLYLVGEPTGWALNTAYKFTQNDNVYTLELENGLTGEWKIWDGTWAYNFGAGDVTSPESGVEADAWFNAGNNFKSAFSGKTTIVFTLVAGSDVQGATVPSKVVVTAESIVEPDPIDQWFVNVVGPFNNWVGEGVNPNTEGVAEVKGLALDADGFKVKVWNGIGDTWYCNGEALVLDTPTIVIGNIDTLMTVDGLEEGMLYNVTFNVLTGEITVAKDVNTGVEAVEVAEEAPVYFNLQGVKVANPENGIYVKVVNGKASKVVL
ncbi:MAG: hypothetical protein K2M31_07580 [Muribaculaceae bacterium]|nr:hypothetical protein [Muribaculaceae bacterium]